MVSLRKMREATGRRVVVVAVGVVLLFQAAVLPCVAQEGSPPPPVDPELSRLLGSYLDDPVAGRHALLELRRRGQSLPPAALLMIADALLRGNQPGAAEGVLRDALGRSPDPQVTAWANLGLGWIALVRGDLPEARARYEQVAAGPWGYLPAGTVLALIGAMEGNAGAAVGTLDAIADAAETPYALRGLARLGAAYALYWDHNYPAAADKFAAVATEYPASPLADDAQYGAAWARYRAGDRAAAIEGLRALAGTDTDEQPLRRGLLELRPDTVLRSSYRRYKQGRVGRPEDQLVSLLDLDGHALAKAALLRLAKRGELDDEGEDADRSTPADAAGADRRHETAKVGAVAGAAEQSGRLSGDASADEGGAGADGGSHAQGTDPVRTLRPPRTAGSDILARAGGRGFGWLAALVLAVGAAVAVTLRRRGFFRG